MVADGSFQVVGGISATVLALIAVAVTIVAYQRWGFRGLPRAILDGCRVLLRHSEHFFSDSRELIDGYIDHSLPEQSVDDRPTRESVSVPLSAGDAAVAQDERQEGICEAGCAPLASIGLPKSQVESELPSLREFELLLSGEGPCRNCSVLTGRTLLDTAARYLQSRIPDVKFVSVHVANWRKHCYQKVALAPGSETLTQFARVDDSYSLSHRMGNICQTFRAPKAAPGGDEFGITVDDIEASSKTRIMDRETRSERTWRVMAYQRCLVVINLESRSVGRFSGREDWMAPVRECARFLRGNVERYVELLFADEMAICNRQIQLRDKFDEKHIDSIRDHLDQIAVDAFSLTDTDPDVVTVSVAEPGSVDQNHFGLFGLAVARRHAHHRSAIHNATANYVPDQDCPTEKFMSRAIKAAINGEREKNLTPVRIKPGAASSIPSQLKDQQKWFLFVPIVDGDGRGLGWIYLHYFCDEVYRKFDRFSEYHLRQFAAALAPLFAVNQARWYAKLREENVGDDTGNWHGNFGGHS